MDFELFKLEIEQRDLERLLSYNWGSFPMVITRKQFIKIKKKRQLRKLEVLKLIKNKNLRRGIKK